MKHSIMCAIGHIKYKLMLNANEKILSKYRHKRLNNKRVTIISNNCWAGYIYRIFNLQYQTPTIGLFIMPDDYIKFIKNLKHYLYNCNLTFIDPKKSKHYDALKNTEKYGEYPIGLLGDIEIYFMHYKTKEEATIKWQRRTKRINWKNIIIKFNDQNGCKQKHIDDFNKIKLYKKMICFTAKKIPGKYNIYMGEFKNDGYVVDDKYFIFQHLNIKKLIDS